MIQPVKLNNSSISQIHNIKQKVLLPIVTLPLVAYMNPPKIRTRERNKLIDKEQIHISKPVTERTKYNTEQLKKLGYKDKDIEKMLKTDGHLTEEGEKIFRKNNMSFKGSTENDMLQFDNQENFDLIENMPPVYDDSVDIAEIGELDKAIAALNKVINNPLSNEFASEASDILTHLAENSEIYAIVASVAAEVMPIARFVRPIKDLSDGDFEKSAVGAATRGVDMVLSPLKLFLAGCSSFVIGTTGLLMNQEDLTYVSGFKDFYTFWADLRDEVECNILGRPTKADLIKQRKEEAEKLREKLLKEKENKQKAIQEKREESDNAIRAYQRRVEEYKADIITQMRTTEECNIITSQVGTEAVVPETKATFTQKCSLPENWRQSEKNKTQKCLTEFYELLEEYKRLRPNADISNYDNWEKWSNDRLRKNSQILRSTIQKCYHKDSLKYRGRELLSNIHDEKNTQVRYDTMRARFSEKLEQYKRLKPKADTSDYQNWQEWSFKKLVKNYGILEAKVEKILARS